MATRAELLTQLSTAESAQLKILQALESDEDVVEYTIDGQVIKRDPQSALAAIQSTIRFLKKELANTSTKRRSVYRAKRP